MQNKASGAEIGRIPVDSIYSPVLKVTYKVEATRVEQRTDFDKLILDVETKNSISPRDALASAGKTLVELFGLARELNLRPRASRSVPRRKPITSPRSRSRSMTWTSPCARTTASSGRVCTPSASWSPAPSLTCWTFATSARSPSTRSRSLHSLGLSLKDSPATFDPSEVAGYDVATGTWTNDSGYDLDADHDYAETEQL